MCLLGATAAVASWAIADVVILDPGAITGQVSFGGETVTHFDVRAYSTDGLQAHGSYTTNPYSLTVESDHAYTPRVYAYFDNSTASSSYLEVSRWSAVAVDNDIGPTTVDFVYPDTRRIGFTIDVTGGTINQYSVQASAYTDTEAYYAQTHNWFNSGPSSTSSWTTMIPSDEVTMSGYVYVTTPDGNQIQRSLGTQTVDVSAGGASVSWSLDLTDTGTLAGDIELTASDISYHYVQIQGIYGTPSEGVYASTQATANDAYTIDLPPGDYHVYLSTYFTTHNQMVATSSRLVSVAAGATSTLDFLETLGHANAPLTLSGFFTTSDLSSARLNLSGLDPGSSSQAHAYSYVTENGQFEFSLPSGTWKRSQIDLSLYDLSDPQLPLNNQFYRYHYDDGDVWPVFVTPGVPAYLGAEEVTLVKTNVYFDVQEATPEAPEILLSNPRIYAHDYVYNPNGSLKAYKAVYAYGSSASTSMSALTMVAEPGTYSIEATAMVNGNYTEFPAQSITFAQPAATGTGENVPVTPVENEQLRVDLSFDSVTGAGVTTVVETPLGPEAPEGLKAFCADGAADEGIECSPVYYDIRTTAEFEGSATVCVRRKFQGANGLAFFLRLYHYDENAPPGEDPWEELPPPPGMEPATDCAADLAACGCADEASCGIDFEADPPVSVIMICGVTDSFSPFAVFQDKLQFTNKVGGQVYEGPTGPPSLQTFTVPADGTYRITATGARGAAGTNSPSLSGGCGAQIAGTFTLQSGDELQILVGQKGTAATYSGGGGGGSFVASNGAPLVIAGGGGGVRAGAQVNGRPGSVGTAGTAGSVSSTYTSGFIAGGTDGLGGARASSYGAGGGGWSGNGASDGNYGEGGFAFSDSTSGGNGGLGKTCGGLAHGGYGGGGAGNGCYGGGGGGGYSGGGGGRVGGGGGSWNAGADPAAEAGVCTTSGHGLVTIERVGQ
jgi:hypothetical protein